MGTPSDPARCLVFDLGAGSGRAVVAELAGERLSLDVVHRFSGYETRYPDGPGWAVDVIRAGLGEGLRRAGRSGRIDRQGRSVDEGRWKPSTETRMHLTVYDQRACLETRSGRSVGPQPPNSQTVSEARRALGGPCPSAPCHGARDLRQAADRADHAGIHHVPRRGAALAPCGALLRRTLARHDAILLQNHGALTDGHDPQSAWFKVEALDYYAKVVYLAAGNGGPRAFTAEEVDKLIELKRTRFPSPGRHPFIP